MTKATDNSQFSVSQLYTFSNYQVMWYDYDEDASFYDHEEIDFLFQGVRCRTAVYLGTEEDFLRSLRSYDPFTLPQSFTPVLAGPSPR